MKIEDIQYLKWMLNELNNGLELTTFSKSIFTPLQFDEIVKDGSEITQLDRLLVAAEVYRWVMGGKWRLLDLEKLLKRQTGMEEFGRKRIKEDIKHLIDDQELLNEDVLKMCLLLTGIRQDIIDNAKYVIQKRFFYTGCSSKLWSSIGYYDMKDKSIHVSTGGKAKDKKVAFPIEDIIETATHELGHHIYISIASKRFKIIPGTVGKIRKLLKGVKTSASDTEHKQWTDFYTKDYGSEWDRNKSLQIIPKELYIRYGIENEMFAQVIGGKTTISKTKRKQLIDLINQSCQL